jgi:uncharacterized protein YabN with tetrapyrrole methylase and pyrophosphatase domain
MEKTLHKLVVLEREARDFGFDWPDQQTIFDQIESELLEIKNAITEQESPQRVQEEIGDLFHGVLSLATFLGYDIEKIIEIVTKKFGHRIDLLKQIAKEHDFVSLKGCSTEQVLLFWKEVKKREQKSK